MPRWNSKPWTPEEIKLLKGLVKTHTYEQMAEIFKRSADAIRWKVHKLSLRKYILHKTSSARNLEIFTTSERIGVRKTAAKFRISVDAVKNARRRVLKIRAQVKEDMTPDRFNKIRFRCFRVASQMGFGSEAEEFAGWVIVKLLEGRDASIENLAKDYLEALLVRGFRRSVPIVEDPESDEEGVVVAAPEPERYQGNPNSLVDLATKLKLRPNYRLCFLLHYNEGFAHSKIAMYLKISESRVSQMLKKIRTDLLANAKAVMKLKNDALDE